MNTSENMKTLLETVDKINNGRDSKKEDKLCRRSSYNESRHGHSNGIDRDGFDIDFHIETLQQAHGKGNAKVNNLIDHILRIGYSFGHDYENNQTIDVSEIRKLQAKFGNGKSKIEDIIKISYTKGYYFGCEIYEIEEAEEADEESDFFRGDIRMGW